MNPSYTYHALVIWTLWQDTNTPINLEPPWWLFFGCKWSKIKKTNFEHQSMYMMLRESHDFDRLQLTDFDVGMGFRV